MRIQFGSFVAIHMAFMSSLEKYRIKSTISVLLKKKPIQKSVHVSISGTNESTELQTLDSKL